MKLNLLLLDSYLSDEIDEIYDDEKRNKKTSKEIEESKKKIKMKYEV